MYVLINKIQHNFYPDFTKKQWNVSIWHCLYYNGKTDIFHLTCLYENLFFSCDQAALWMVQSVCLSVRLSVCLSVRHTFLTMFPSSYHHEIFRSCYQWLKWHPCKRSRSGSKVKVTEVNSQLSRFRTVTPAWIQISWWNDAQSLMLLRRGALLFFNVIRQISKSHSSKNRWIWPKLGVSGL